MLTKHKEIFVSKIISASPDQLSSGEAYLRLELQGSECMILRFDGMSLNLLKSGLISQLYFHSNWSDLEKIAVGELFDWLIKHKVDILFEKETRAKASAIRIFRMPNPPQVALGGLWEPEAAKRPGRIQRALEILLFGDES